MDTISHERLLQTLSAMLIQVNALQTQVGATSTIDRQMVRDGLSTVEHMARDALYMARCSDDELAPPELEGVTLADALSRLVEETAETLGLSSRVSFSGIDEQGRPREHTLSSAAERIVFLIA